MAAKSKALLMGITCAAQIASTPVVAESEGLTCTPNYDESERGLVGTREPGKGRRCITQKDVRGPINIRSATYAEMIALLTGFFSKTGGSYTNGDFSGYTLREPPDDPTTNTATVKVDRKSSSGNLYTYADCWYEALTFSWSEGEPCKLGFEFLGTSEAEGSGTISAAEALAVVLMSDATLTVAANTYYAKSGEIKVAHNFESRFPMGSLWRGSVGAGVLTATVRLDLDLNTDNWLLHQKNITNSDALAVSVRCASGSLGVGLDLPQCCVAGPTPTIGGAESQAPSLNLRAYKSTSSGYPTVCAWTKAA